MQKNTKADKVLKKQKRQKKQSLNKSESASHEKYKGIEPSGTAPHREESVEELMLDDDILMEFEFAVVADIVLLIFMNFHGFRCNVGSWNVNVVG